VAGESAEAEQIERRMMRAAIVEHLRGAAEVLESRQEAFGAAGALMAACLIVPDAAMELEVDRLRAQGWLLVADAYHKRGQARAAAMAAGQGSQFDSKACDPMVEDYVRQMKDEERHFWLVEVERALLDGNPERAAEMVTHVEKSGEFEAPDELRLRIEQGKRDRAVTRARVALHSGDGKAALDLLRGSGHEGPLLAEARLLAGDVPKGVAGLAGSAEEKTLVLLSAARKVLDRDAARAARLGLEAVKLTGGRPGTIALLTEALSKAGDPPPKGEPWDAVRAAIFSAVAGGEGER